METFKDMIDKTIVFDLDGTLCITEGLDYKNAKPFLNRIKYINTQYYEKGYTIIVDTARASSCSGKFYKGKKDKKRYKEIKKLTKQQLKDWGLKYHKLRVGHKIPANRYVDDKAIFDFDFFVKHKGAK